MPKNGAHPFGANNDFDSHAGKKSAFDTGEMSLEARLGFNSHFSHCGLVFPATVRCSSLRILWFIAMLSSSLHFPYKHLMRPNTWTWKKCAWNLSDNSFKVNYVARASGKDYFPVCVSCRSETFLVIIWEAYNGCNL